MNIKQNHALITNAKKFLNEITNDITFLSKKSQLRNSVIINYFNELNTLKWNIENTKYEFSIFILSHKYQYIVNK